MRLVDCRACGSKELLEEDGIVVCAYCQARYIPDPGDRPVAAMPERTHFDVVLDDPGRNKIGVIKVVRELNGSGLKQAKDLVESTPKVVLQAVASDEAQRAKARLEAEGGRVSIV